MFNSLLVLLGCVGLAVNVKAAEWAIDTSTTTTILIGVGISNAADDTMNIAAGSNGQGNYNQKYTFADGKYDKSGVMELMYMDVATSRSSKNVIGSGMFDIIVSNDNGATFTNVPDIKGVSQAVYTYGDDGESLAAVGAFDVPNPSGSKAPLAVNGVVTSTDNGATWSSSDVPAGYVRYGAFPSENTWYISSGMWNTDEEDADSCHYKNINARLKIPKVNLNRDAKLQHSIRSKKIATGENATGWFGTVSKTTDGGKTWTEVFKTDLFKDYIYFNQITCSSNDHCLVAAEGVLENGAPTVAAFVTFDGGKTWDKTYSTNEMSLMSAKMTSETDVWLAPVIQNGHQISAQFMLSKDGGKTFELQQSLDNCMPIDIDFGVKIGGAACVSSSGTTASAAYYK